MSTDIEVRDNNDLNNAILISKDIVTADYLGNLSKMDIVDFPKELKGKNISDYTRLYHIKKIVTDKDESALDKLVTVLNSATSSNSTVITIVQGNADETNYFIGVVSKDIKQEYDDISTQGESFKCALQGNFAGIEFEALNNDEIEELIDNITVNSYITSISGIASVRNEEVTDMAKYVQGIEHMTDALKGKEYNLLFIADPVNNQQLELSKLGYEKLYTQLSTFMQTTLNFNETDSLTITDGQTESFTKTMGTSTSLSQSYNKSSSWTKTTTENTNETKNYGALLGAAGAAIAVGAVIATGGLAAVVEAGAVAAIGAAGGVGAAAGGALIGAKGKGKAEAIGENKGINEGTINQSGSNQSEAEQTGTNHSVAEGTNKGRSIQFNSENKTVKSILENIDKQLERLQMCKAYGAFNCAAYVITSDSETSSIVANSYNALMKGDNSSLQASYINNWLHNGKNTEKVKEYIKFLAHPMFKNDANEDIIVTPATISSSYETAVNIGLPKKSINGLTVLEMASFGRKDYNKEKDNSIELGKIHHMGADEKTNVSLDINSLCMHTFVTGSTGSGKSNAVYSIIDKVIKHNKKSSDNISFMVVEPAKGEYKDQFGNRDDVTVYGTNFKKTPLLRINPFSFPDDIHILEHIDRLVEIFNVCWPMYAAMPAVLKDSIERAYINSGWDLSNSECKYKSDKGIPMYPSFNDVLYQINVVMEESKYSADSKGDYKGALCTRIKSLTNGLYGQIFTSDELTPKELYDSNVIIDLSRVGSIETKSLIMGLLIVKMQEYRMSTRVKNNTNLHHLTILEEAHNLLKRTSTEQSSDSANLLGKSVEMLANSIAEMRTYGEGFVIVDQAPELLDMSVIRNTNTKIILRLPDFSDRELVGKAAALNDNQILELAKLKTGIATVYQNDWLEPVLCHISKFDGDEQPYTYNYVKGNSNSIDYNKLIEYLLLPAPEKLKQNIETIKELENMVFKSNIVADTKLNILKYLKADKPENIKTLRSKIIYSIFNSETALALSNSERYDITSWYNTMLDKLEPNIDLFDKENKDKILAMITKEQAERVNNQEVIDLLRNLNAYVKK